MAKNLCSHSRGMGSIPVRKLKYHIPYGAVKKKKINAIKVSHHPYILLNQHFIYLISFMYHYSFILNNVLVFDPFGIFLIVFLVGYTSISTSLQSNLIFSPLVRNTCICTYTIFPFVSESVSEFSIPLQ